jgi:hypothetical protein
VGNTSLSLVFPFLDDLRVLVSFTEERIPLTAYAQAIGEIAPEREMGLP